MLLNIAKQIICSVIILIIFCIIFAIKRNIIPGDIIFYESFQIAFVYIFILFLISNFTIMFPKKFIETTLYSSFLLIILFNVTIPTILDRSVSVTVIGSLKKSAVPLSLEEIRNNFQEIYVLQQDAVNIRLKEQIANGNIQRNDEGNFYLTKKGEFISQIMLGMSNAFNVNTAYIDQ